MSETTYEPIAKLSDKRGLVLFEEVLDEIEAHDFQTWNQATWLARGNDDDEYEIYVDELRADVRDAMVPAFDCGTVACLLGHVVFKAGARMALAERGLRASNETVVDAAGEVRGIFALATERLELPPFLARYISHPDRTWAQILAFRDAWRQDAAVDPHEDSARDALVMADDRDSEEA